MKELIRLLEENTNNQSTDSENLELYQQKEQQLEFMRTVLDRQLKPYDRKETKDDFNTICHTFSFESDFTSFTKVHLSVSIGMGYI
jgi:formyltetrahydrofolate hydrolase